jgi:hypothetical protein
MKLYLSNLKASLLVVGMMALAFPGSRAPAADLQHSDISFAVHKLHEENVEGPDVERTYFIAGGKRVVFGLPKACRLTVDSAGFLLLLTDADLDGEIHISRSGFTPEADLASEVLRYREAASMSMPKDATNIELQPPMMNPYPYNGWKSIGFSWRYSFAGRSMVRTMSYINLEMGVQVAVTTLALQRDAEKVNKIARQFMSSWWVMKD